MYPCVEARIAEVHILPVQIARLDFNYLTFIVYVYVCVCARALCVCTRAYVNM